MGFRQFRPELIEVAFGGEPDRFADLIRNDVAQRLTLLMGSCVRMIPAIVRHDVVVLVGPVSRQWEQLIERFRRAVNLSAQGKAESRPRFLVAQPG